VQKGLSTRVGVQVGAMHHKWHCRTEQLCAAALVVMQLSVHNWPGSLFAC